MSTTKTNPQRRLAKIERDETAWLEVRERSFEERRQMAAEVLAAFFLKDDTGQQTPSGGAS